MKIVNADAWASVEAHFDALRDLSPDQRAAGLATITDEEVRREVASLLDHARPGETIAAVVGAVAYMAQPTQTSGLGETAGAVIGPYHLLQKIGEGGMGEVWLAEQRAPVRRRVALKLVKAGMNSREIIARFEAERQALALMDHPAIAKVFDAGATPQGAPYFVMEYVAGAPITTYCDNHRLSTRERLELFLRVCEGVQHAHQKAVIHRDLKPSNILVMEVDGRAAPKIIDFGVAKALTQKLTADSLFTRLGTLIGTPEYMSPEQANSAGEDIDTRTDVYSLGVIFYELLAGATPLDLKKAALDEFLRRLREDEPPKPSTRIRTQDHDTSTAVAHKRQTEPGTLTKQLRGDLDSIALKALEKDRARRYGSPSDFAADIGRYLRNEAVLAVPQSARYRARKFARRYRVALATVCAFVLVMAAAAAVSIRQSVRANREAAAAKAINDFLEYDLLAQASSTNQSGLASKPDPELKVRTALDRAALRIAGKFDRQPEVEAAIRDTMGQTYMDLGSYPAARAQLERARDLFRRSLGPENPKTLTTMRRLGNLARIQANYPEAEAILSQTVQIQSRVLGPEHPDTLISMNGLALAYIYRAKYPQAESLQSKTLEIQRRLLGPENPRTLDSMSVLAHVNQLQANYPKAEALYSQVVEIQRRVLGPEHPSTVGSMSNLANVYVFQSKYAQAEELYSRSLEIQRHVSGPEHPDTLRPMNNLAVVYTYEGKYEQAETLNRHLLDLRKRLLGPENPETVSNMNNLAVVCSYEGKYAQAEALDAEVLEIRRRLLGPEHPDVVSSMGNLAAVYSYQGKYAQAEALQRQVLEIQRRVLGPQHTGTLSTLSEFVFIYQRQGKFALAETYAAQALAGRRKTLGSDHPNTMASAADLALAYISQGKFAESEPLAREALETNRKKRPDDWARFRAESLLGASLAGQKKYAEAEPLLLEGYQGMAARKDRIGVPDWYHIDRAREWIVQLYQASGKPDKAAGWRKGTL